MYCFNNRRNKKEIKTLNENLRWKLNWDLLWRRPKRRKIQYLKWKTLKNHFMTNLWAWILQIGLLLQKILSLNSLMKIFLLKMFSMTRISLQSLKSISTWTQAWRQSFKIHVINDFKLKEEISKLTKKMRVISLCKISMKTITLNKVLMGLSIFRVSISTLKAILLRRWSPKSWSHQAICHIQMYRTIELWLMTNHD